MSGKTTHGKEMLKCSSDHLFSPWLWDGGYMALHHKCLHTQTPKVLLSVWAEWGNQEHQSTKGGVCKDATTAHAIKYLHCAQWAFADLRAPQGWFMQLKNVWKLIKTENIGNTQAGFCSVLVSQHSSIAMLIRPQSVMKLEQTCLVFMAVPTTSLLFCIFDITRHLQHHTCLHGFTLLFYLLADHFPFISKIKTQSPQGTSYDTVCLMIFLKDFNCLG